MTDAFIEKLEQATEGSRELDAQIFFSLLPDYDGTGISMPAYSIFLRGYGADSDLPHYTTSIDAARTLGGMLVFASDIGADGLSMVKLVFDTSTTPVIEYIGISQRLELAWCIAALKAGNHEEQTDEQE